MCRLLQLRSVDNEEPRGGLIKASRLRGDSLHDVLNHTIRQRFIVHIICHRDYTDARRISQAVSIKTGEVPVQNKCILRSDVPVFIFRDNCLFCGTSVTASSRPTVIPVRTLQFRDTIFSVCGWRNDE